MWYFLYSFVMCFFSLFFYLFKKKFFFNVLFIFETERDRAWTGEGQRERETQNLKQAPGSEPSAQSPTRGSNSQTARWWPELKSDVEPTEPPRRPYLFVLIDAEVRHLYGHLWFLFVCFLACLSLELLHVLFFAFETLFWVLVFCHMIQTSIFASSSLPSFCFKLFEGRLGGSIH